MKIPLFLHLALWGFLGLGQAQEAFPPVPRRLPPQGIEIPNEVRAELTSSLLQLQETYGELENPRAADAGVFLKGVEFALMNGEFYREKDINVARKHLEIAAERMEALESGNGDWGRGPTVRGYESSIDGSLQPYGLDVPENLDLSKPVPLLVWMHGRGDKSTDLYFIEGCRTKSPALGGKVGAQQQCIVLYPFGRQCVGWKHAGEIDLFEAIADVKQRYPVKSDQVILAGFSMGGAGAWHIGAHYADQFSAVHAGAGFAETAEYNHLKPEDYPVWYEQTLWGLYDVPDYARNFLNVRLLAYSGEIDKQKQAADLMARELHENGLELEHVIGPGMGHKYHEDSVPPIFEALLAARRQDFNEEIHLQTRTLRYSRMGPVQILGLEEHWKDSRVDLKVEDGTWTGATKNVRALSVPAGNYQIDGQKLVVAQKNPRPLVKLKGQWQPGSLEGLQKRPGLQGPIDDAFMSPFLVVLPSESSQSPAIQSWLNFEIGHFAKRWRELMRGRLPVKRADEVTKDDIANYNLICWGEPATNSVISATAGKLPLVWGENLELGKTQLDAAFHLPLLIYPNPLNPERYMVLNSGLTFRENHDGTNSLQNPKLPDWALIDVRQAPDGLTPGKVIDAGFFGENWKIKE